MKQFEKKFIAKKSEDPDRWYTDVILKAELADYSPVKGCMVIRPHGYGIWENIQDAFNRMIKKAGVSNAYFPLFIPYSFLNKEKEHIEGFSPQLAIVTIGGGEKLAEPLVVRPTSETIMYSMYAKWVSSWRDLPILINQWNNVVRWEKRTYLFLRTTEFLWQEGHTAHESEKKAVDFALRALSWYKSIYEEYLALYPIVGVKSASEKFAGGKTTWAIELLMPDGKALQGATSHNLGQNFAKVFDIKFQNHEGKNDFVWQTSWGLSTRSIGGLVMAHGDDNGLVLPPKISPVKAAIITVAGKEETKIKEFADKVRENIENVNSEFPGRVEVWDQEGKTYGWRVNQAEMKGIPLILIIGPKEVESGKLTLNSRDRQYTDKKVDANQIGIEIEAMLRNIQRNLLEKHKKLSEDNTHAVDSYEEFKKIMAGPKGFIKALWCENPDCEAKIKAETKATTRVLPFPAKEEAGKCIYCGKAATHRWYFAQAY